MTDENDLMTRLKAWDIEPLDGATRDRILGMALRAPQSRPFGARLAAEMEQAFSDWCYGLNYKIAALAACLVLGLGIGFSVSEPIDVAGVALIGNVGTPS